jgi:hypothetical protein
MRRVLARVMQRRRPTGIARVVFYLALLSVPLSAGSAVAQSTVSTDVGVRTWLTTGYTRWNFDAEGVAPLSELRWRGTDAVVSEANVDLVWRSLVLMVSLGGGRVHDGAFIDDDFALSGHQFRFSYTRSAVEGHVFYGIGDIGYRFLQWHERMSGTRGFIDVFVGYQYWEEEYEAFGFKGFQGPPLLPVTVGVAVPDSIKGITHTYRFHSVRVGARAEIPLAVGLAWRVSAAFLPFTRAEQEDIHHLRPDFQQDPSARTRADGGFGYQVDAALTYQAWRGLIVEAGYRVWGIEAGKGTATTFFSDGTTSRNPVTDLIIERGGPYVGVRYRF